MQTLVLSLLKEKKRSRPNESESEEKKNWMREQYHDRLSVNLSGRVCCLVNNGNMNWNITSKKLDCRISSSINLEHALTGKILRKNRRERECVTPKSVNE